MINNTEVIKNRLFQPQGTEFVEQEIKLLFSAIAEAKSINDTELFFKTLDDIHFVFAKAAFKEGLNESSFLREFIYDLDRTDDVEVRLFQSQKLRSV